jgi:hypothetical protein
MEAVTTNKTFENFRRNFTKMVDTVAKKEIQFPITNFICFGIIQRRMES